MPIVVDLGDGEGLRTADGLEHDGYTDLPYFLEAARCAARCAPEVDRFAITYSPEAGGVLTQHDVWLLLGDESATPLAQAPNCPLFRTYGDSFHRPRRRLASAPALVSAEIVQWARNRLRAALRNPRHLAPGRGAFSRGWLPLGTPALSGPLPAAPAVAERPVDVSFRGSVGDGPRYAPKTLSRRRMASALARLPDEVVSDFVELDSFTQAYQAEPSSYVQSLLSAKICLVPRGGSLETYRTFEAAAAGCVLVTEPLPPAWFYASLPRVELRSWAALPQAVGALLSDPARMSAMAAGGRAWAADVVGAEAIGRWIAHRLDAGKR